MSAQWNKYGNPYGSYGGYSKPYKQYPYKQYDPYDDDDKPRPSEDRGDMVPFKRSGVPLLAVVALDAQRVTVYDTNGRMIQQSPISTGTTGYETPAGIFSVVQKKADHNSNLYEDGNMPFMQRITWTGIALHAGVLPGRPASHGCIRLPMDFAQRLFDLTDVGMRVVIVRNDIALADFDHPQLFKSSAARNDLPARPSSTSSRPAARGLARPTAGPEIDCRIQSLRSGSRRDARPPRSGVWPPGGLATPRLPPRRCKLRRRAKPAPTRS